MKKKEIKHYFYFSAPEAAGEYMRTVPIEKETKLRYAFQLSRIIHLNVQPNLFAIL